MNKPASFLSAAFSPARFTTAEFLRMCDSGAFDNMKVELVDGELERMPPPGNEHGRRQMMVGIRLSHVIAEELLRGEVGIDLGQDTVVGCDAAVLVSPVTGNRILQPHEVILAVEVAETTRERDMGMKRIKYAAAGIAHYWVVDGDRSVVHVWGEPVDGDYAQIATVRFGEPLAVPGTDQTIVIAWASAGRSAGSRGRSALLDCCRSLWRYWLSPACAAMPVPACCWRLSYCWRSPIRCLS